jgi:hypothetical protein
MNLRCAFICIVVSTSLLPETFAMADDLDRQERALKIIRETAADICNTIAQEGGSELVELSGNVKAKLGGAVAKIADLGIEGAGKYRTEQFKGPLQQEVAKAVKDNATCRLEVLRLLQEKMLGHSSLEKPAVPPGGANKQAGRDKSEARAPPLWVSALRHSPIVPGKGLAGLSIGDDESLIHERFKVPVLNTHHVVGLGKELFLDDRKGFVSHYATTFKDDGLFLGIYSNRDTRKIERFRVSDNKFNPSGSTPSYQGVTIGTTREHLLAALGKPIREYTHLTCPSQNNAGDTISYVYDGVSFWVCVQNDLVYLISITSKQKKNSDVGSELR